MVDNQENKIKEVLEAQKKQDADIQTCSIVLEGIKTKFAADIAEMNVKVVTLDQTMGLLAQQMEQVLLMQ